MLKKKNVNVENLHINDATVKISTIKIENRINRKFA